MVVDNHGREINYMRLAVTDRCNLRCFYCMPASGIQYVAKSDLLSYEEMLRLISIGATMGINKLRITGGEPFVRKGMEDFLQQIVDLGVIEELSITTNGTFTSDKIPFLERLGIHAVNLSLDSLDRNRFHNITRRDVFEQVMETYEALKNSSIHTKINMVVMDGKNIEDILPMLELTRKDDVSVRFIEEMPFNGTLGQGNQEFWPERKILEYIRQHHAFSKLEDIPSSTSSNYRINGHVGSFGIIAAFTRTFCGSCNRIRITPQGELKTCLYDHGVMSLRDLIRSGANDAAVTDELMKAIGARPKDGFEAEVRRKLVDPVGESMATIGG